MEDLTLTLGPLKHEAISRIEVMPVVYEIDKDNAPETVLEVTTPPHTTQPNYRCAKGVLQWNDSELHEDVIGRLRSES